VSVKPDDYDHDDDDDDCGRYSDVAMRTNGSLKEDPLLLLLFKLPLPNYYYYYHLPDRVQKRRSTMLPLLMFGSQEG